MKNETTEFKKSPVLPELASGPEHLGRETVIAILLGLLPIIAVAIFIATGAGREAETTAPPVNEAAVVAEPDASTGSAEAAEQDGYRWRSAMAAFYARRALQHRPIEPSGSLLNLDGKVVTPDGAAVVDSYGWRSALDAQPALQQGPFESSGSVRSLNGGAASYEASNFKLEEDRAGAVEQKLVWMVESSTNGAGAGDKLELYPDRHMEE